MKEKLCYVALDYDAELKKFDESSTLHKPSNYLMVKLSLLDHNKLDAQKPYSNQK